VRCSIHHRVSRGLFWDEPLEITSPVGPPHISWVEAGPLLEYLVAMSLSAAIYPIVIDATSKAPTSLGGLGIGISNHLQPAPMNRPRTKPTIILSIFHFPSFIYVGALPSRQLASEIC
jgi:hypothetical protein